MSRRLFAFLLKELKVMRIQCKKCGCVTELEIGKANLACGLNCPGCTKTELVVGNAQADKITLATLIAQIKFVQQSDVFDVEFVLPDEDGNGKK